MPSGLVGVARGDKEVTFLGPERRAMERSHTGRNARGICSSRACRLKQNGNERMLRRLLRRERDMIMLKEA